METKDCKYCVDEICTNADCPMRADYCPVPNDPEVCRFEDRQNELTIEEIKAEISRRIDDEKMFIKYNSDEESQIYRSFVKGKIKGYKETLKLLEKARNEQ